MANSEQTEPRPCSEAKELLKQPEHQEDEDRML